MREEDQTPKYNTAQMLVKCLEKESVEYIFGIPGEENLEIMEAAFPFQHPLYYNPA